MGLGSDDRVGDVAARDWALLMVNLVTKDLSLSD